ncbi:MAG: hypothetical protein OEW39_15250 [Deltaproteobacteria bacterium]|nr:hypothetical protein [Deltaproteobacteria bacterium]
MVTAWGRQGYGVRPGSLDSPGALRLGSALVLASAVVAGLLLFTLFPSRFAQAQDVAVPRAGSLSHSGLFSGENALGDGARLGRSPFRVQQTAVFGTNPFAGTSSGFGVMGGILHFLTYKSGNQNPTGGDLFTLLEQVHGPVQGPRQVRTAGVEFDYYGSSRGKTGMGLGVDAQQYKATFQFRDPAGVLPPEDVFLKTASLMFTLKGYLRLGYFYPFYALGLGNYYIKYQQYNQPLYLRETLSEAYTARVGFRSLFGRVGILAEGGYIQARTKLEVWDGVGSLQFGGVFKTLGVFWAW